MRLLAVILAPAPAAAALPAVALRLAAGGGFVNLVLAPVLLVGTLFLVRAGAGRWSTDEALRRKLAPT